MARACPDSIAFAVRFGLRRISPTDHVAKDLKRVNVRLSKIIEAIRAYTDQNHMSRSFQDRDGSDRKLNRRPTVLGCRSVLGSAHADLFLWQRISNSDLAPMALAYAYFLLAAGLCVWKGWPETIVILTAVVLFTNGLWGIVERSLLETGKNARFRE